MNLSVLIPYEGDEWRDTVFEWLTARYAALLPDAEMCVGTSMPFNRSAARNDAFSKSSKDYLLIADADTVFHVDQILRALDELKDKKTWVIPYGDCNYYNLSKDMTVSVLAGDPAATIPEPSNSAMWEFRLESWAGLLVVPRVAFETVGGYDERFIGWGEEDLAFRDALNDLWGPMVRTDGYALHLWHPTTEHERFEQPFFEQNRRLRMKLARERRLNL